MNISSNKPNCSIQQQLNYHSRKRGKNHKHKHTQPSPLIQQPSSTIFIQSRCRSQTPTLLSLHHSLLSSHQNSEDHGQILIISNSSSEGMLILEKEQNNETSYEKQQDSLQLSISKPSQMTSYSKSSKKKYPNAETKDKNIVWINEEQFQKHNMPQKQTQQIKNIIKEQEQQKQYFYADRWHFQPRKELSNIEQMSSRAEDDSFDQNFQYQQQHQSRKPISPQSQPLRKMALGGDHFRHIEQKSWITIQDDDCSSLIDELDDDITETLLEAENESKYLTLKSEKSNQNQTKTLFPTQDIINTIDNPAPGLFQQKIQQLQSLKKQVSTQNVKHIEQIQWILQHQQSLLSTNLTKQTRLKNTFTTILALNKKIDYSAAELQNQLLEPDNQIMINQYLLRKMTHLIHR